MGWGEPHDRGVGTTGQIEIAHDALDSLGVERAPLACRVLALVGRTTAGGFTLTDDEMECLDSLLSTCDDAWPQPEGGGDRDVLTHAIARWTVRR